MKKCFLMLGLLLLSSSVFAQYPEITIMDIQYQDPDSLLTIGDQPSPYNGDTVTVTGLVMVAPYRDANPDSGTILIAGAPALYLQDTTETDWAGILVRFPGSTAAFNILDTGTVIKATGIVDEFFVTTQLNLIGFEGSNVIGFKDRPDPVLITLDSLAEIGSNLGKPLAEKWEGVYVEVRNITSTNPGSIGSGSFDIFDGNNTLVIVGNQSSYFRNNIPPPAPGTQLEYVRGYIQNRDNLPQGYGHLIMPAYPNDVKISSFPPLISNITRNLVEVGYGDPVIVSANIEDQDGTVSEAKLFYRKNMGAHNELVMNNVSGNLWQATIPAQNDSSLMDFFIRAVDNENNISLNPSDTSSNRYFYLVLNRPLVIQDVQYSPFGSGFSGYNSYEVSIRGIVTADTTDIQGDGSNTGPKVYMQNGSGPWSGIWVSGTETLLRRRGDDITVTGTVEENFSVTRISGIDDPGNIQINATGQTLPDAEVLSTATIDLLSNGSVQAEQWESVLIKYEDIEVTDENADGSPGPGGGGNNNFGEILVADASTQVTRVELQDGTHHYHNFWAAGLDTIPGNIRIRTGSRFDGLAGILFYSFGNYKLLPRKDDDFIGFVSDIATEPELPETFSLTQNYPNPFNPSTRINFSLPLEAYVTLKIYDILGQEVMTLVDNELISAGVHEVSFNANGLPTGVYIYSMRANDFVQTKKMLLLK